MAGLNIILLRLQVESKTLFYALQFCLLVEVMCHADILPCIEWPFNCLSVLSGVPPVYAPNANMKSMKGGAEPVLSSVNLLAYSFHSGSCSSSKTTPCRKEGSLGTHLSPTFSALPKGPVQQVSMAGTELQAHLLWSAPSSCDGRMYTAAKSMVCEEGKPWQAIKSLLEHWPWV